MEDLGIIKSIAEQGLGYLLFIGAIFVIAYQNREIKSLNEKRIKEAEKARDSVIEPLKNMKNTVDLIFTIVQKNS